MRIMRIARNQSHSLFRDTMQDWTFCWTVVIQSSSCQFHFGFVDLIGGTRATSGHGEQASAVEGVDGPWTGHERAMNQWTLLNMTSKYILIHLISIGWYWMLNHWISLLSWALGDSWSVGECAATPQLAVLGTWQWIFFSQELPADERLMNLSLRLYEHHMMACPK
jgi:hypothetical protein